MEILNLEVICYLWTFKQFMLYLLYNNILAIEHNENIASSKINRACPTLFGDIERVLRCTGQGFAVHRDVNSFLGLISEDLKDLSYRWHRK